MDNSKISQVDRTMNQTARSGRFYVIAEKWYFLARDYQDQGPFDSKIQAELALKKFLTHIEGSDEMSCEWELIDLKLV